MELKSRSLAMGDLLAGLLLFGSLLSVVDGKYAALVLLV